MSLKTYNTLIVTAMLLFGAASILQGIAGHTLACVLNAITTVLLFFSFLMRNEVI